MKRSLIRVNVRAYFHVVPFMLIAASMPARKLKASS